MKLGDKESRIQATAGLLGLILYTTISALPYYINQPITFEQELPSGHQVEWYCSRPRGKMLGLPLKEGSCVVVKDIKEKELYACLRENKIIPSKDFFFMSFSEDWGKRILEECEYLLDQNQQENL